MALARTRPVSESGTETDSVAAPFGSAAENEQTSDVGLTDSRARECEIPFASIKAAASPSSNPLPVTTNGSPRFTALYARAPNDAVTTVPIDSSGASSRSGTTFLSASRIAFGGVTLM